MKNIYCTLLLVTIALTSCIDNANFSIPDGDSKIVAYSEISPDEQVTVKVSTSVGLNTNDSFLYPENAELEIYVKNSPIVAAFRYNFVTELYEAKPELRLNEQTEYELRISIPESDFKDVAAFTEIPSNKKIASSNLIKKEKSNPSELAEVSIDLGLQFPSNAYFRIKPYRRIINWFENGNGEIQYSFSKEYEQLEVVEILKGLGAVAYIQQTGALIIDGSKLSGAQIDLRLKTTNPIDETNEIFNHVYFEVETITSDVFKYQKAVSTQLLAEDAPISEPVIAYTNFEHGLGLFGGTNVSLDSLSIQ